MWLSFLTKISHYLFTCSLLRTEVLQQSNILCLLKPNQERQKTVQYHSKENQQLVYTNIDKSSLGMKACCFAFQSVYSCTNVQCPLVQVRCAQVLAAKAGLGQTSVWAE